MSISIFGFQALWSPYFFIALTLLTVLFFLAATKWRHKFKDSRPLTKKETILFLTAMITIYIIKGSPVDVWGHILFSVHMVQMGIFYLLVPPLLIAAIPNYMWKTFLNIPVLKQVFNFLTKPLVALIVFNGAFSFYHIPLIFDTIKVDMVLHSVVTGSIFILAFCMWWPLVNTLEGEYKLSGLKKVGYIFADGILLTPACALIIFASSPMYETFFNGGAWLEAMALCVPAGTLQGLQSIGVTGPELFSNMPPLEDQQVGGVIMKIIQEIIYGYILAQVFFEWYRKEKSEEDALNASLYEARELQSE
ncbi:cytochrome c oxidase assembly factor CtaG [Jeotgalibacillus sp. R-1-5s-1]|uniref:cytochrome c oxidase assembly factor CtaG n=1 Tax=Jeotgalibacillus sp. R-1-5s-1 TaxID=2555897 RepID=UPI00106D1224|nr:cytochrome c oxidase assembly factor CtaG [Jeotgalibacillus sp. R-1-5s-1]TFE03612.1 cytochrome c oxidase assembly factor CtaG [Jeotgalibacillus sp. R-1-5s-1]